MVSAASNHCAPVVDLVVDTAPAGSVPADPADRPNRMTERVWVVGTPVSAVDMATATTLIRRWIQEKKTRYVCVADVHSVMRSRWDPAFERALKNADLIVADGMPLVWTAWSRGVKSIGRVAGPDFMHELCRLSPGTWTHFLLGGTTGVSDRLAQRLTTLNQQITICGTDSPPFRPRTGAGGNGLIARIHGAEPTNGWVGGGCPKQELWMSQHAGQIPGAIVIGVGAAFNFLSGHIPRAPRWMQNNGLEWLHRLVTEPRRLWRRYLVIAPMFAVLAAAETFAIWWRRPRNRKTLHHV